MRGNYDFWLKKLRGINIFCIFAAFLLRKQSGIRLKSYYNALWTYKETIM